MKFLAARTLARTALVLVLAAPVAGCAAGRGGASSTSTQAGSSAARGIDSRAATPVVPIPAPSTTTTNPLPSSPQASAGNASTQLVTAWASGDRAVARAVATPTAVAALFAAPYPGAGLAIPRGCSVAFPPLVCTYGPPGGASPSDSIYQLYVSQDPGGWYVSSVSVQP